MKIKIFNDAKSASNLAENHRLVVLSHGIEINASERVYLPLRLAAQ
jgi:hypothetical protein